MFWNLHYLLLYLGYNSNAKMDLNKFGKRAFSCATRRAKISGRTAETLTPEELHEETMRGLHEEVIEVENASEIFPSDHLPQYSEAVEELVDVAIVTITELYRRGVDIDQALHEKMKFNENR